MSREHISTLAEKLFFTHGTKAVSIDDIAAALGMSKKTIYNFFSSKEEIVEYDIDRHLEQHTCDIAEIKTNSKNAIDELIQIYKKNYEQHNLMKPIFISDIKKFHPQSWLKLENFFGDCIPSTISDNIRRGQREGFYREGLNVELIAYLYFKSIFSLIEFFANQKRHSITDLDREYIYYHIHAIGTPKGIKYLDKINLDQ